VPLAPGGGVDFVARTIGQKLSERLGKPVLIEIGPAAAPWSRRLPWSRRHPTANTLLLTPGATLSSKHAVYQEPAL